MLGWLGWAGLRAACTRCRLGCLGSILTLLLLLQAKGVSLAQVLAGPAADLSAVSVAVNGLVDGAGSPEEVAQEALALVQQGYSALKIKASGGRLSL